MLQLNTMFVFWKCFSSQNKQRKRFKRLLGFSFIRLRSKVKKHFQDCYKNYNHGKNKKVPSLIQKRRTRTEEPETDKTKTAPWNVFCSFELISPQDRQGTLRPRSQDVGCVKKRDPEDE